MRSTAAYIATAVFSLVATSFLPSDALAQQVPAEFPLKGEWKYQSFRPDPASLLTGNLKPTFIPFSPPGAVAKINADGTGTLEFIIPPAPRFRRYRSS